MLDWNRRTTKKQNEAKRGGVSAMFHRLKMNLSIGQKGKIYRIIKGKEIPLLFCVSSFKPPPPFYILVNTNRTLRDGGTRSSSLLVAKVPRPLEHVEDSIHHTASLYIFI